MAGRAVSTGRAGILRRASVASEKRGSPPEGMGLAPRFCYYQNVMLGPAVNAIAIIICALAGCFLVRGIPSRIDEIIKKAIGFSVVLIGIKGALENQDFILLLFSMVIGGVLGELINIDALLNRLGIWIESRLGKPKDSANRRFEASNGTGENGKSFSKAFVSASILYCTGSMAILGSIQSGLNGNHQILFAKSVLDGVTSIVFGASMGIGVVFSALPVFIYQAAIALASRAVNDILTPEIIQEMSAVGSLIIAATGFNILGFKEVKVANFIPAIFIPLVFLAVKGFVLRSF
jgi:uncharacterized membrane protein YqgA involved in biofilm formation